MSLWIVIIIPFYFSDTVNRHQRAVAEKTSKLRQNFFFKYTDTD